MKVNLQPCKGKKICVAVSGGKDSMALLHYLFTEGGAYDITVCVLNCDHGIRGEDSERDSAFVTAYCGGNSIELHSFKAEKGRFKSENDARNWRRECYFKVLSDGSADLIATAHHANDNAETVLFNLARGAALAGMKGIYDEPETGLIRPFIAVTREEIDCYIKENGIPFVTDESNFTDDYTRNKIRRKVLPVLQEAVPGAIGAICRFSRLAAEDEEYFDRQVSGILLRRPNGGYLIKPCNEKVVFRRAAQKIIAHFYQKKDYTAEHLNRLYELQSADNGRKFEFLGLTAVKEEGGIAVTNDNLNFTEPTVADGGFGKEISGNGGVCAFVCLAENQEEVIKSFSPADRGKLKKLRFDAGKIPHTATVRYRRAGDKFNKFGGGTKSLSDYLTDKKVPQSLRGILPLICDGNEVLIVGGVEISDKVKVDGTTQKTGVFICFNPLII